MFEKLGTGRAGPNLRGRVAGSAPTPLPATGFAGGADPVLAADACTGRAGPVFHDRPGRTAIIKHALSYAVRWSASRGRDPTLRYMSSQPIRIESDTLRALRERSAQSGEPIVRLAQRYIDEGMRLDRHPGIVFRDGPAGRRAVVVGGPDVWEIVSGARSAPERGQALVAALAERVGVPSEKVRIAIRYYAEYHEEVDRFVDLVEEEAERLEQTLERERRLLE